jgi:hypothetical protein
MGEHGGLLAISLRFHLTMYSRLTAAVAWPLMRPERVTEARLDPSRGGKWTADISQDLSRGLGQRLEMPLYICEQKLERAALMIMGHDPSRDAPEP